LLATRSKTLIDWDSFTRACSEADIIVSDRRMPRGCESRWLKLDAPALRQTGGVAIYLGARSRIDTVAERVGAHPWSEIEQPISNGGSGRRAAPGSAPAADRSAAPHTAG
jgi:competence protein ComEC